MTASPQHPKRLGRYDILERLAVGGMAEVYLAVEHSATGIERLVVVKRILPHLVVHDQMVRMFLQEARLAARINHPNVVQILELGEDSGQPYIAMEYVAGITVRDLSVDARKLSRPIPVGVAVQLIAQAAAGAHAAHELREASGKPAGLVHRDLSPHNLIVDRDGHVKLLDFGIAKAADDVDHTRTGVLKGKIRYMSPEQCNQGTLDRRSDLFTLGIVLWELLAGERLFERQTELQTMQAITQGQLRDLRMFREEVPDGIVAVLETALQADREKRQPTADHFRRALLDAAAEAGLQVSQDITAVFVADIEGPRLEARQTQIEMSMNRPRTADDVPTPFEVADLGPPTSSQSVTLTRSGTGTNVVGLASFAMMVAAALLVLLAVVIAGVSWYNRAPAEAQVLPPMMGDSPTTGNIVTFALPPVHDAAVMLSEYEPVRRYLEATTGRPFRFTVSGSYADAGRMLIEKRAEFAVLPPYAYIATVDAYPGQIQTIAMKLFDGSTGTDGVLLVREDVPWRSASDLAGHTICYTDPESATGYVLPRAWLRAQGIDPDTGVIPHLSKNHFQAIRDLATQQCDVAATYSGAWFAADVAGVSPAQLRVLAITGRTPHDAVCAGPSADLALRATVQKALLALDPQRDVGVARIGEAERITGFVPADDSRWDELRHALAIEGSTSP